jgi:hypothetical protein
MVSGLIMPEKRMYSVPLFMPICFSPATIRLPLLSTSTTVTPMVPVKALLAAWLSPSEIWWRRSPRADCRRALGLPGVALTLPDLLPDWRPPCWPRCAR